MAALTVHVRDRDYVCMSPSRKTLIIYEIQMNELNDIINVDLNLFLMASASSKAVKISTSNLKL